MKAIFNIAKNVRNSHSINGLNPLRKLHCLGILLCALMFGSMQVWGTHTAVPVGNMVSGEKYIITAEYNSTRYYLAPGNFTQGNSGIATYTTSLTEAAAWTFTNTASGWTISTVVSGTTYYLKHNSTNNGVAANGTTANYFTITEYSSGSTTVHIHSNSRYLALYQSTNWRCYNSTSGVQNITLYKVGASTFTVTIAKNQASWGSVDKSSVTGVANNTSISASSNVLTVGSTIVTATPHAQDANYNYAFSNWSGIPAGGKVTADVTVTANFTRTERTLTNYRTRCCIELPAPTNPNETPSNDGGTLYWDAVVGATGYEVNIDGGGWASTGNGTTCNYTVTGKACGGTSVSWQVRATGDGTTNCAAGAPTTVRNFSTSSCSCTGTYSFHYQHSGAWNAENICFSPVAGATNNYLTDELSLPYAENYKVAWQGVDQSYTSSTGFNGNMPFFHNRDKKFGANPQSGNLGGGKGKFHVYHDSGSTNKYVSFIPTGYTLNFGTGDTWTNDSTKTFTGKTNAWDETEWYTDLITLKDGTIGKKIFVGLQTASGYVWCDPYSQKDNLTGLRTKSGSGESWVTGGLTTSYPNKTGKFRIYANSGDKNWYVTFVPHFQLKYNANGGTGTMSPLPATPVSCEETSGNRTVTVATSSFTAPTGKVFDHWNTAADNSGSNVSTGSYTLTGDVTLYAIWRDADYTVTLNQSPSVGATLTGATNTAHYGGTINISASEPTGYQFVNWTSSPSVTFADATSASTSFTMPASNVTITANYVQVYTVTFVHHDKGTFSGGSTEILVPTSSNTITLPTVTSVSCGFYDTFEGWIASGSEYAESSDKPATVYAGSSSYTVNGNVTLRALYSYEDPDATGYTKITSGITAGTYLISTDDGVAYTGKVDGQAYGGYTSVTVSAGVISSKGSAKEVTITMSSSNFHMNDGTYYLGYSGSSNDLKFNASVSDNRDLWKLDANGQIESVNVSGRKLEYNSGSPRFACYTGGQTDAFLFKKGGSKYCTNPSCSTPTEVTVTYNANGGGVGSITCSSETLDYGTYPALADDYTICNTFNREGYTLYKWSTRADGEGGTSYDPGEVVGPTHSHTGFSGENVTLYAQWRKKVSFNIGNATGSVADVVDTDNDGNITLPGSAGISSIPCGYEFWGWHASSVASTETRPTGMLFAGDTYNCASATLYAVYRLAGEGSNPDLFSLSYTSSGTKYYVAKPTSITTAPSTWASDKVLKFAASTNVDDALAFGKKSIEGKSVKTLYWMYDDEEVYVYWKDNAGSLTHSNEEDTDYGWTISGTTDLTFSMTYPGQSARQIVFTAASYGDPATFNASTGSATSLHVEEASSTSYTYATNPSCVTTATLQFVTNGGSLNYPDTYDASNYVDLTVGTEVYLPTATYPGEWAFEGWMKGSEVTSTHLRPESANFIEVTLNTTEYTATPAGTTTFYAVYSKTVDDKQWDPSAEGTYKIYAIMSDGTTKKYMPTWGGTQTTLTPVTVCQETGEYTITPGTGVHAGQYKITHSTYTVGVKSDGDTQFKNVADTWWNIEPSTSGKGTYRITVVGSSERCMSYGGTGFFGNYTVNDVNRPSQPGYRDMEIGECIYTEYTSTPENIPYITITGSPIKITSTNGQRVYSPTTLHVEAHNFTGTRTLHFEATNGFSAVPATANCGANGAYSGDIQIYYQPSTDGDGSITSSVLTVDQRAGTVAERISQTFTAIQGRNMPANFAIAVKSGTQWYALMDTCRNSGTPKAVAIEVNDNNAPTAASLVPHDVEWSLHQVVGAQMSGSRPKDKIYFYEPNAIKTEDPLVYWNYALKADATPRISTGAQVGNISSESSAPYEWGLTTSDLCAYTIGNAGAAKNISINTAGTFGTHATNVISDILYLLPITAYYEPAECQVVEWKANSVVVMYLGNATQASVQVGGNTEGENQTLSSVKVDHGVYELAATGLTSAAFEPLQIVFKNAGGTEIGRNYVAIPAIISGEVLTSAYESQKDIAESNDVVILKNSKLTTTGIGTDGTSYKFTNVTVYGGGKLDIASGTKLGVTGSLILRAGGVVAGAYDYVYPQLNLGGTLTNTSGKFYYEYVTDYTHWYHYVLPFDGTLNTIHYPTEYYGSAVAANNTGSWIIKRYAGEIRATGNYDAWVDIESESATVASAGHGYIYWGAPKKVTANGVKDRQAWGIQRIAMSKAAETAKTEEAGDKTVTGLGSYSGVSGNSGKNNDQGWNLIGNPYMVNLTGLNSTSIQVGQLVHTDTHPWDGKWEWDETDPAAGGLRYVTIPDDHFDNYNAQTMTWFTAENPMKTGRTFFVQIAGANTSVAFAAANRAALMPAWERRAEAEQKVDIETGIVLSDDDEMRDEVNFWIKNDKTEAYEYNADYPKTPNNTNFNIYGVHEVGQLSWVAISPEIAEGSMAIGYQVPAAGDYTLSLSETYVSDKIEALYVTDHEVTPEFTTNLMEDTYSFGVKQAERNDTRFTARIVLKDEAEVPTDVGNIDGMESEHPLKFLYRDKLYILRNGVLYDATGKKVK